MPRLLPSIFALALGWLVRADLDCAADDAASTECFTDQQTNAHAGTAMLQKDNALLTEAPSALVTSQDSAKGETSLETDVGLLEKDKLEAGLTGSAQIGSTYLVNDVTLLESEMAVLKSKTVALEKAVGNRGVAATGAAEAEETAAELLAVGHQRSMDGLKARVAALEQDAADVNSRVSSMEGEVNGRDVASLVESTPQRNDNLQARVGTLKRTVTDLNLRVQTLETVRQSVNDVTLMEREMRVLKSKTAALEKAVGNRDAAATAAADAEEAAAELLAVDERRSTEDLKARVASLEQDAADVQSRVTSLEVEVGNPAAASLLEDTSRKNDNLDARIAALKSTVDKLKMRVHKLETGVTGLVQQSSKYLVNDVTLLESEMAVLKSKTVALEKAVGNRGVTATGAAEAEETAAELLAVGHTRSTDGLKARVAALEQDAADVNSRVSSMEGEVNGRDAASLVESAPQRNDNLQERVSTLKRTVTDLKLRVQTLETVRQSVNDVTLMEREMRVLKSKTAALEKAVGNRDAAATAAADSEETVTELLAVDERRSTEDLKARVASLEQDAADVQSRVTSLEVEVGGPAAASLLEHTTQKGDNLQERIATLKSTVDKLKMRVHKLETGVTGLVQQSSKYLVSDVTLLESEMAVLKSKTVVLEKAVGNRDATATGAEEAEETTAELLAVGQKRSTDGLKARVAALEQDAADVMSRVTSMEGEVNGLAAAALVQGTHQRNDNLQARVTALQATVADLKIRMQKLETSVTGLIQKL